MDDNNELTNAFQNSIGKLCVIYAENGFRYEAKIINVFKEFVEFYDTKKGFTKIIKLSAIKEVDFR